MVTPVSRFEQTLSTAETLSVDEQEALIQILQRRLAERRQAEIAANIVQAKADDQAAKCFAATLNK
jgi:16S rRNA C1402 N4-methylase RsmH